MAQLIRSNQYTAVNGNKFDILKFLLAILIVGIHSSKSGMIFRPVLRLAVPLFFIISSYLFFLKQTKLSTRQERFLGLKNYSKRILRLYFFWFLFLLPSIIYYREWYIDFGVDELVTIVRSFLFGSTFVASWFLMASLIGVVIVWLLASFRVRNSIIIGIGIVTYVFCCLVSNYYNLISHCPTFLELYKGYTNFFFPPFNSFPCSLLFVGIGKLLAEREFAHSNRRLWSLLVFSMVMLYLEYFISQNHFKAYYDDCFLMLPLTCVCIFMLIGQSQPVIINYDTKKLRSYSTIIYCCHGTILKMMHLLFIKEVNGYMQFAMFAIAIALSIAIGTLFLRLEKCPHLSWLKYSY